MRQLQLDSGILLVQEIYLIPIAHRDQSVKHWIIFKTTDYSE